MSGAVHLLGVAAGFEQKMRMAVTTDRASVSIHRPEFAVMTDAECRDVVKEGPGVERGFRFQIPENDERVFSIMMGQEFVKGVSQSRLKGMPAITDKKDDVRMDPFADMLPGNAVMIEKGVAEELDFSRCAGCHGLQGAGDPGPGKLSGFHIRIYADPADLKSQCRKGYPSVLSSNWKV